MAAGPARRGGGVRGMAAPLLLAACAAAPPPASPTGAALVVTSPAAPFTFADGAAAKRQADADCGQQGVRSSIYDRFDETRAAWVFPEGCA